MPAAVITVILSFISDVQEAGTSERNWLNVDVEFHPRWSNLKPRGNWRRKICQLMFGSFLVPSSTVVADESQERTKTSLTNHPTNLPTWGATSKNHSTHLFQAKNWEEDPNIETTVCNMWKYPDQQQFHFLGISNVAKGKLCKTLVAEFDPLID